MSARNASTFALGLAVWLATSAIAAPGPFAGILNGPATWEEVGDANRTAGGCGSQECAAMRDVGRAFMVVFRRDVPGTMAHVPQPADPSRAADDALQQGMLVHRSRYGAYCTILTKLAAHYSEYFIGHASVELANRMDDVDGSCTPKVLSALPHTGEVAAMMQDAEETCRTDGRTACGRDSHR